MKYLKTVYRYRYDEKNHSWSVIELSNVLVSGTDKSYNLSDTLDRDAQVVLRIIGNDSADVLPQDIITYEKTESITPMDKGALVVVAVFRNSNGSPRVRHTKIICK